MMGGSLNLYSLIGIPENADTALIKQAVRMLRRRYHPDVNPAASAEEVTKAINAAWDVLRDPERRLRYDQQLRAERFTRIELARRHYAATPNAKTPYAEESSLQAWISWAGYLRRIGRASTPDPKATIYGRAAAARQAAAESRRRSMDCER